MTDQKIAFLFPGQGSQYPGIGSDLHDSHSIVRDTYQEASDTLGYDIARHVVPDHAHLVPIHALPERTLEKVRRRLAHDPGGPALRGRLQRRDKGTGTQTQWLVGSWSIIVAAMNGNQIVGVSL